MYKKLHDSCGNELRVGDRVSWFEIMYDSQKGSVTKEIKGKNHRRIWLW